MHRRCEKDPMTMRKCCMWQHETSLQSQVVGERGQLTKEDSTLSHCPSMHPRAHCPQGHPGAVKEPELSPS